MKLLFIDIRKAYFHAKAIRRVFIKLPEEDCEEGMCGLLLMSLYGTRDAAQNWEACYVEFMESIGFTRGKASPCTFLHKEKELRCVVHGDDFTILGEDEDLDWHENKIKDRFSIKLSLIHI